MKLRYHTSLIITVLATVNIHAQTNFLAGEFWYLADIYPGVSGARQTMDLEDYTRQALAELREEAVFVFSGMLYGFTYTYTPGSKARGIPEQITLEQRANISRVNDMQLDRHHVQEDAVRIRVRYNLSNNETLYQRAWASIVNHSGGMGAGEMRDGIAGKLVAIEKGLKESILAYLKRTLANRPHTVSGSVLLRDIPRIMINSGQYHAIVETKVRVDDVRDFDVF